jgi:hypothetical protein
VKLFRLCMTSLTLFESVLVEIKHRKLSVIVYTFIYSSFQLRDTDWRSFWNFCFSKLNSVRTEMKSKETKQTSIVMRKLSCLLHIKQMNWHGSGFRTRSHGLSVPSGGLGGGGWLSVSFVVVRMMAVPRIISQYWNKTHSRCVVRLTCPILNLPRFVSSSNTYLLSFVVSAP